LDLEQTFDDRRAELDRLQAELAARSSTLHFAHAAVTTMTGLMALGASLLLRFTPAIEDKTTQAAVAGAIAVVLLGYAMVRFWVGRLRQRQELHKFEHLKALRRELNLEDPSALLPR
jgi:hypothetical protein